MSTPNACSLERSEQDERLAAIERFTSQALLSTTPTEQGVLLRLESTEAVRTKLWNLVEAEKRCCPFLDFRVRIADDEIWLEVTGPADVRPTLREMFGAGSALAQ